MKAKRILYVLGSVDDKYIAEMYEEQEAEPPRRSVKKVWLIAAIVAVMLLLVGCVAYMLSLNDLLLGESNVPEADKPEATEPRDILSLQGFVGSANYQAAKEWNEFEESYDPNHEILGSLSHEEAQMPEEYLSYNCYTMEMTAKVDEICEKYGLRKQGLMVIFDDVEFFCKILGIDGILSEDVEAEVKLDNDYLYKTGSFAMNGITKLTGENSPWIYDIEYQLYCAMKTDFDTVALNIGNVEDYDQWTYTTREGIEVLLALSTEKALVIVDKEKCFITMNIMNPRVGDILYGEQMMGREALEAFADTFDFSITPHPPSEEDWEAAKQMEQAEYEEYVAQMEDWKNSDANPANQKDISDYIQHLIDYERTENLYYGLYDLNDDGEYELLIGDNETSFGQVVQFVDGSAQVMTLGFFEGMYLCEGNVVESTDVISVMDGRYRGWFYQYDELGAVFLDCVVYDPERNPENPWFRNPDGGFLPSNWVTIPESEYNDARTKYPRVEIKMIPISEYPLE